MCAKRIVVVLFGKIYIKTLASAKWCYSECLGRIVRSKGFFLFYTCGTDARNKVVVAIVQAFDNSVIVGALFEWRHFVQKRKQKLLAVQHTYTYYIVHLYHLISWANVPWKEKRQPFLCSNDFLRQQPMLYKNQLQCKNRCEREKVEYLKR